MDDFKFDRNPPENPDRDNRRRDEKPRDFDQERSERGGKPFPNIVMFAGLIWMGVGALGMVSSFLSMGMNPNNQAASPGGACCPALFAFAFLYCGYQTVTGTAKDTRGNAGGSILFGMLQVLVAGFIGFGGFGAGNPQQPAEVVVVAGVVGLMGGSLILAGILALAGRTDYLEWREQQHPTTRKSGRGAEMVARPVGETAANVSRVRLSASLIEQPALCTALAGESDGCCRVAR